MVLTKVQEKAVTKIVNHYHNNVKLVNFTAPTGSGKTFMIANVISRILETTTNNDKIIFVIFTLSQAELPIQFKNKLDDYQDCLTTKFNTYFYDSPSSKNDKTDNDYHIKYKNKDVLIFGTSSFGKGRIFTELKRFEDFVNEVKENYKLIYIRDEAHIGDKKPKDVAKNEQELINKEADFIIKMTATPDADNNGKNVYISEKELNDENENKFLLKINPKFNIGFENDGIDDDDILETAIKQFKEIKIQYHDKNIANNYVINPAMLIQISSKNQSKEIVNENDKRIDEIINKLNQNNLSWVIYLSERKESSLKEGQTKNSINLKEISKITVILM